MFHCFLCAWWGYGNIITVMKKKFFLKAKTNQNLSLLDVPRAALFLGKQNLKTCLPLLNTLLLRLFLLSCGTVRRQLFCVL